MADSPLVTVQCLVYNHEPFLRQCLDGFVMQETSFPFEVLIHDDASTDGSAAIIREYAEKYPDIIRPIFETENQHAKHDGSLRRIVHGALNPASKYVALCEGDDYWTDKYKLQKQVSFLESHPEYNMCCNRTLLYSEKDKRMIAENHCYDSTRDVEIKDVVRRTGLYISTCSIVYRKTMRPDFGKYRQLAPVGDYPLQILCALKGKIRYFDEPMSVYRVNNSASWMSRQQWGSSSPQNLKRIRSMVDMFQAFANDYPEHAALFRNKVAQYVNTQSPIAQVSPEQNKEYFLAFKDITDGYPFWWKIDLYFRKHRDVFSRFYVKYLSRRVLNRYRAKRKFYRC
ncbi:MAG: glycosyltransferase [Muribaculaceae bacterium]|nr:glycosyltransferase [Muribaculaceae bacterium]